VDSGGGAVEACVHTASISPLLFPRRLGRLAGVPASASLGSHSHAIAVAAARSPSICCLGLVWFSDSCVRSARRR